MLLLSLQVGYSRRRKGGHDTMSTRRQRGFARDELRAAQAARFASNLAEVLQEVRLTHKELARLLGVTHHTVDSWTRVADPMMRNAARRISGPRLHLCRAPRDYFSIEVPKL